MSSFYSVNYDPNDPYKVMHLGYKDVPINATWGPASRDECILQYVLNGSGSLNGNLITAGQGFYIPSNRIYECHYIENDPWDYFWILISDDLAKKYVEPLLNLDENNIFSFDFKDAIPKFYLNATNGKHALTHFEGLSIFFSLLSMHQNSNAVYASLQLNNIHRAKNYIKNHLRHKTTVKKVAEKINVNDRYLYNLFVKYEHITPKEFMDSEKISATKKLLKNTDMSISEIAENMGYDDVCNFSKFFSKRVGMSPTNYRNSDIDE